MMVRCGACRSSFDVPGPGRHACPACGATNQVGGAAPGMGGPAPAAAGSPLAGGAPIPAPPPITTSKVACPECSFSFIVGEVDMAVCPNCGAEVQTGVEAGEQP
jgi:Zn finger protein HypA/HybF involved in hydrogenase expression